MPPPLPLVKMTGFIPREFLPEEFPEINPQLSVVALQFDESNPE